MEGALSRDPADMIGVVVAEGWLGDNVRVFQGVASVCRRTREIVDKHLAQCLACFVLTKALPSRLPQALGKWFPHLAKLEVHGRDAIESLELMHETHTLSNLKELSLFAGGESSKRCSEVGASLLIVCKNLEVFRADFWVPYDEKGQVTGLKEFWMANWLSRARLRSLKDLIALRLKDSSVSVVLEVLSHPWTALESLEIVGTCNGIDRVEMNTAARTWNFLSRLKHAKLEGKICCNAVLHRIAESSGAKLESLFLRRNDNEMMDMRPVERHCKNLKTLETQSFRFAGDTSYVRIAAEFHQLQKLILKGSHGVSSRTIWHAVNSCEFLWLLDVSFCEKVDNLGMQIIGESAKALRELHLEGCTFIDDKGLKLLAKGVCGAELKVLNMSKCVSLTDEGVLAIPKWMKKIREFRASWCNFVTLFSLEELAMECELLSKLVIMGSQHLLHEDCLILAQKAFSPLQIVFGHGDVVQGRGDRSLREFPKKKPATPAATKKPKRTTRKARMRIRELERALQDF